MSLVTRDLCALHRCAEVSRVSDAAARLDVTALNGQEAEIRAPRGRRTASATGANMNITANSGTPRSILGYGSALSSE